MAVIPLGASLPLRSSHLPADSASSVIVRLLGVAPDGGYRVSPAADRCDPARQRLVSVALFIAFIAALATTYGVWALPSIPLFGARTFLPSFARAATVWLASSVQDSTLSAAARGAIIAARA